MASVHRAAGSKIVILGCPGSGKSTFARKLHELTGMPLVHLDNVWWKADRTHISREEFDRELETLLGGDRWIMDGDYSRTYEARVRACDTVIFLDYDMDVCMDGIKRRVGMTRTDMPWVDRTLDPGLAEQVERYREENRPAIYALLEKYPEKTAVIFRTRSEADEWLSE